MVYIKVNSMYYPVTAAYIRNGGSYYPVVEVYVRNGGSYYPVYLDRDTGDAPAAEV